MLDIDDIKNSVVVNASDIPTRKTVDTNGMNSFTITMTGNPMVLMENRIPLSIEYGNERINLSTEVYLSSPLKDELVIDARPYDRLLFVDFYAESGPVSSPGTTTLTLYLDSSSFANVKIKTSTTESTSGRSHVMFRVLGSSTKRYDMVIWRSRTTGSANITSAVANFILV